MSRVAAKRRAATVPGQYLGYSLQQLRLCHYLLWVPDDDSVSLEHLDDVAVHRADSTVLLEQCKSAGTNPVSDRAEALWNTFANWADQCANGVVKADTTDFRLYVTPEANGSVVSLLHSANTPEASALCLTRIKKLLTTKRASVGCNPHIRRFLKAGDDVCQTIIQRFRLISEVDPTESVLQFLRPSGPKELVHELAAAAIGLARDRADLLIRTGRPPIVSATVFRRQWQAFSRRYDLTNLLSKAQPPSEAAISTLVNTSPVFVRQLQVIEASEDMLLTAVSDFLRTTADKVLWAEEGIIVEDSFNDFDLQLERQHKIARDEIEDVYAKLDEACRGRALYRKCTGTAFPLEGRALPTHFVAGAYNCLADDCKIGWHPNYQMLFPR